MHYGTWHDDCCQAPFPRYDVLQTGRHFEALATLGAQTEGVGEGPVHFETTGGGRGGRKMTKSCQSLSVSIQFSVTFQSSRNVLLQYDR